MSAPHVMIMAAGTGGHIFPGLAVAERLMADGVTVSWLGTPQGLENRLVPARGIDMAQIDISGLRGRGALGWLKAPFRVLRAMLSARRIFKSQRPDCVLSMGGYVAGPGGLMARLMGIPLLLHEQNAVAGLTNRCLRPFARRVLTGFPQVLPNGEHCGNPVRREIAELPAPTKRYRQRTGPLRVLVVGGSQGAAAFSRLVPAALALIPEHQRPQVTHQAGRQQAKTLEAYESLSVEANVIEFIDDMAAAWGEVDVAICRSGALTVAELAAAGVPAVLVPFPYAVDDHQTANAKYLSDAGAAWLMPENTLTAEQLASHLMTLEREMLLGMAERARALAMPDAVDAAARACREVCQ